MTQSHPQTIPRPASAAVQSSSEPTMLSTSAVSAFLPVARIAKARAGLLAIPGRTPVRTPSWIATSSRGVVPHLTPDNFAKYGNVEGLYVALEDFIEKGPRATPPIYTFGQSDKFSKSEHSSDTTADEATSRSRCLHSFIGLDSVSPDTYTVLSARRPIPVAPATSNGARSVSVCTSVGFRDLETTEYNRSIGILKPDAAVLMADILYRRADSAAGTSRRRMEKMGTRSVGWVRDAISELRGSGPEEEVTKQLPLLFAPILPIPIQYQLQYLDILTTDEAEGGVRPHISGIVLPTPPAAEEEKCDEVENGGSHDKSPGFWQDLPPELDDVARLSVAEVNTPHEILTHIQAGAVDIFTLSFVNQCTDAGVALTFEFKPTISEDCETTTTAATASTMAVKPRLPLGIDLWCTDHKADVSPLLSSCGCYTCTTHHRAYLHHCLDAKEMLAWTMLQIHNHAVVTRFFDAVRGAIIGADVMAREEGGVESRPGSETTTTTTGQKNDEKTLFDRLVDQFVATHESEMPMGTGRGPRVRGYQFKSEGPGESKKNPLAYTGLGDDTSADAP